MPEAGTPPGQKVPQLQRAKLSNGMNVILAERHEVPVVNFTLAVDAGTAVDPVTQRGLMSLTMSMLDEGTKTRNALQIGEELESLGANLSAGSNSDQSFVDMSTLKTNVDKSLDVFADVILNPSFPAADFAREQKLALAGVARQKAQPAAAGMRVFPGLVFGKEHPYGSVVTESTLREITRDALVKTHQTWFKPSNSTLIVVGDTTLAEVTPRLEKLFAGWKPGEVPKKSVASVQPKAKQTVYIIDKPGAIQSVVFAGHVAPPKNAADGIANETLNMVLGGSFTSRINMNLREDKHWTYGARTGLGANRGQRTFFASAPVQSDKTKETMQEILNEFRGISGDKPVSADELEKAQAALTLRLPGALETSRAVGGSIVELLQFGLPEDYHSTYAAKVRALKPADMVKAGSGLIHSDGLIWVVVGDRAKVEPGIRELNLGEIRAIDADGNPVQ
jgi:zinc protease